MNPRTVGTATLGAALTASAATAGPIPSTTATTARHMPATRCHVVASDFPGSGRGDAPSSVECARAFDHLAQGADGLVIQLAISSHARCLFDHGAPVGYRLALAHPARQAWLRERRPPTLVARGANDPSFIAAGATVCRGDLPDAEIHLLDAGHLAQGEENDEIARLPLDRMARQEGTSQ